MIPSTCQSSRKLQPSWIVHQLVHGLAFYCQGRVGAVLIAEARAMVPFTRGPQPYQFKPVGITTRHCQRVLGKLQSGARTRYASDRRSRGGPMALLTMRP